MLLTRAVFTLLSVCVIFTESKNIDLFLVPEELQTILNVIYSRLPPIKLGSDQRFGLGFRLGRNADAQILVELGPQSETQPLGDNPNKRENRRRKYWEERRSTTTENPELNTVEVDDEEKLIKPTKEILTKTEEPVVNRVLGNVNEVDQQEISNKRYKKKFEDVRVESEVQNSRRSFEESQNTPEPFFKTFIRFVSKLFNQR